MENWILLVLGLGLAATTSPLPQQQLSYEEAVLLAVDLYNQEPEVELAFRLLEAKPQPDWDPTIQSFQQLEFTVQETTCLPSKQLQLDKCDFKDQGMVKECHGTIFSEQGVPVIRSLCETADQEHIRNRRGIRKIIRKIKKGVKKGFTTLLPSGGIKKEFPRLLPGGGSIIAQVPNGKKTIALRA